MDASRMPLVLVHQPGTFKVIGSEAKDDLEEWEKKMFTWAGLRASPKDIFMNGGTCTDSGNDCDQD